MRLANIQSRLHRAEIALADLHDPARFLAMENQDSEGRTARTDFRDENLEANIPAASGESTEERKPLNRRSLTRPTPQYNQKLVSSRCHGDGSNDPSRSTL